MENFDSLGLPPTLLDALIQLEFKAPTPIQAQTIPAALAGQDILGSAQTGTGKTAAYGIPLITHLLNQPRSTALVLTPTRELAIQVLAMLEKLLGQDNSIRTTLLIGGDPIVKQFRQLKGRPRLIVGTPGRINDHLSRRSLSLKECDFLVLDETDRMLDMGFGIQLEKIAEHLPEKRQTLMFSATLPPNIVRLSKKYLHDATHVSIGATSTPADRVKQEMVHTSEVEKYPILLKRLNEHSGSFIIFVKTKVGCEKLAKRLRSDDHRADAIHGDLHQRNRERILRTFRDKKQRILVATDIAARGLDIPHIEYVVNYDLPQCPEDYIHRIGRTGRAGAEGTAINLITSQDGAKWRAIHRLLHPHEKNSQPKKRGPGGPGMPSKYKKNGKSFVHKKSSSQKRVYYGHGHATSRAKVDRTLP